MRTRVLVGTAVVTALLTAAPLSAAAAATTHVLTAGSVGGSNVKVGATLKAGLKAKTQATFYIPESTTGVACSKSAVTSTVTKNPAKPGTADESVTALTFSKCTTNIPGATSVKSVKATGLPYKATVSDATGDPVTVTNASVTATVETSEGPISCTYTDASVAGNASNKGSTVTFSNQAFTATSSSCPIPTVDFSATYGPVQDTSVAKSPHVFVN